MDAVPTDFLRFCPVCHGRGATHVPCGECDGAGRSRCTVCNGNGSFDNGVTVIPCWTCKGEGTRPCGPCSGSGQVMGSCRLCQGEGVVPLFVVEKFAAQQRELEEQARREAEQQAEEERKRFAEAQRRHEEANLRWDGPAPLLGGETPSAPPTPDAAPAAAVEASSPGRLRDEELRRLAEHAARARRAERAKAMRGWSRKALVVLALGGAAYGGFRMTRQRPAALQALIPVEPAAPKRIEAYAAKWTRERAVTEKDLAGKTAFQLNVMRFEILARHGYKIDPDRKDVAAFFREAPWYNPQTSRMNKVWDKLSRLERANYRAILQHQRRHGLLK